MANCTDCDNYFHCYLVEDGVVDIYTANREKDCSGFVNCLRESSMSDNDRFVIGLVVKPKECNGCEYVFETCEVTCEHNIRKGKTRAEYEIEIAELIYKDVEEIVLETINETIKWKPSEYFKKAKSISKKTVDRLFGEGE